MAKLFISYRRTDDPYGTHYIRDRLAEHFGRDALFMDIDDIPFGIDFVEYLDQQVGQCDILLAMIGERWLEASYRDGPRQGQRRLDDPDDFVRIEILSALERNIPVIPVILGQAAMPAKEQLPEALARLARRNAAEVRPGRDFHDHVARLIRGIEYWIAERQREPVKETKPAKPAARVAAPKPAALFTDADFVLVPKGTFWMGEYGNNAVKQVQIKQDFWIGVYPVTQAQWQAVMGNNPSWFSRTGGGKDRVKNISDDDLKQFPVECVSWIDAQEFITRLNEKEKDSGWLYRLPTAAEWEYACRGGGTFSKPHYEFDYYFKQPTNDLSPTLANFNNQLGRTSKVGSYPANSLGIHDMHGNVSEWCHDLWEDGTSSHFLRGGSWANPAEDCRVALRDWASVLITMYEEHDGFRLAAVQCPR